MTRKRFVKLMMSIGVQRNEAALVALLVQHQKRSDGNAKTVGE